MASIILWQALSRAWSLTLTPFALDFGVTVSEAVRMLVLFPFSKMAGVGSSTWLIFNFLSILAAAVCDAVGGARFSVGGDGECSSGASIGESSLSRPLDGAPGGALVAADGGAASSSSRLAHARRARMAIFSTKSRRRRCSKMSPFSSSRCLATETRLRSTSSGELRRAAAEIFWVSACASAAEVSDFTRFSSYHHRPTLWPYPAKPTAISERTVVAAAVSIAGRQPARQSLTVHTLENARG